MFPLPAGPDLADYRALPDAVQTDVRRSLDALRRIARLGGPTRANLRAAALPLRGFSAGSLRRKWDDYKRHGWRALIDNARLPKERTMPAPLAEWWRNEIGANGSGERVRLATYRRFLRLLAEGQALPGVGTWRQWWKATRQPGPPPEACPWDSLNPPPGLSLKSFYRIPVRKQETDAQRLGVSALRKGIGGVTRDLSALRILEMVQFDDFRLDLRAIDWASGQIVDVLGLGAMDVATRKMLAFVLWPSVRREDGSHVGVARRHMLHLVARILQDYGFPTDYDSHWIVENAAATLQQEVSSALEMISGGRIKVHYSQIVKGGALLGGWKDGGKGNPNAKGQLEKLWGDTWREMGWEPGQQGANYTERPASLEMREREALALIRAGGSLPPAVRRELTEGYFHDLDQVRAVCEAVWHRFGERKDHRIAGFEMVREWRWKGEGAQWWNIEDRTIPTLPTAAFDQAVQLRQRPESPNERAARLLALNGAGFARPSAAGFSLLYADKAKVKYNGSGVLFLDRKHTKEKRLFFSAQDLPLESGKDYICLHDSEALDAPTAALYVLDGKGGFLGAAPRIRGVDPRDTEALGAAIAAQQKRLGDALKAVRGRQPVEDLAARSHQLERQVQILADLGTPTETPGPAGIAPALEAAAAARVAAKEFSAGEMLRYLTEQTENQNDP